MNAGGKINEGLAASARVFQIEDFFPSQLGEHTHTKAGGLRHSAPSLQKSVGGMGLMVRQQRHAVRVAGMHGGCNGRSGTAILPPAAAGGGFFTDASPEPLGGERLLEHDILLSEFFERVIGHCAWFGSEIF